MNAGSVGRVIHPGAARIDSFVPALHRRSRAGNRGRVHACGHCIVLFSFDSIIPCAHSWRGVACLIPFHELSGRSIEVGYMIVQ
jgi:hypothetical protein